MQHVQLSFFKCLGKCLWNAAQLLFLLHSQMLCNQAYFSRISTTRNSSNLLNQAVLPICSCYVIVCPLNFMPFRSRRKICSRCLFQIVRQNSPGAFWVHDCEVEISLSSWEDQVIFCPQIMVTGNSNFQNKMHASFFKRVFRKILTKVQRCNTFLSICRWEKIFSFTFSSRILLFFSCERFLVAIFWYLFWYHPMLFKSRVCWNFCRRAGAFFRFLFW